MTTESQLILFEHPLSPYVQKIKIALREKQVAFTVRPMTTSSQDSEFANGNPRMEVPLLLADDQAIFDSSIILQYIEDRWPQPPMLPDPVDERARVRMLEDLMDTHYEANTWALSEVQIFGRADGELGQRLTASAEQEIRRWHTYLEGQLAGRPWFNGDSFGWGDACVIPFVNGAKRFGIDPEGVLADWVQQASERDSVSSTLTEAGNAELDPEAVRAAIAAGFRREYRDHRLEWMVRQGGVSIVEAGLAAGNIRFNDPSVTEHGAA